MKNVKIGSETYTGISEVVLNTADGNTATFKDVDDIEPVVVSDIPSERTFVCTTTTEQKASDVFASIANIDMSRNGIYSILFEGDTAPTQGNRTLRFISMSFSDDANRVGVNSVFGTSVGFGTNSLKAPNTVDIATASASYGITNAYLQRDTTTKRFVVDSGYSNMPYIPANCTITYVYIPVNPLTGTRIGE